VVRCHEGLLLVVILAVALRVGVGIAYRPALFFSDSWRYLSMAFSGLPVGITPSRPSGYPLLLRLLTFSGRDVLFVTVVQHVAGLLVGVLVYTLLLRLGLRRVIAAAAAVVVLLDSYAVALEQFIMAEACFTLLVLSAIVLTIGRRTSPRAVMLAGALLAAACTLRTTALFVIPVWLLYLLWRARDRRRLLWGVGGLMLPLLVYLSWAWRTEGSFKVDQAEGWFLYGRIAQIADCRGANVPAPTRSLCYVPAAWRRAFPPGFWIWGADAPAVKLFGGTPDSHWGKPRGAAIIARDNGMLEGFAIAIILSHPVAYATVVGSDFLRFFVPAASPYSDADGVTVRFPSSPLTDWVWRGPRNRYLPGYVPRLHWPASLLARYQDVFHAPRLLLGALTIVALSALLAPILTLGRVTVGRRAEIFLLTGSGVVMLLASAALVGFELRYLIPTIPLLVSGGLVAANELVDAAQTHRDARRIDAADRPSRGQARAVISHLCVPGVEHGYSVTRWRSPS
jgi:hypothetical protein